MKGLAREVRPWLHSAVAVLLGIVVLLILMALPGAQRALVNGMNAVLYYPEKPAFEIRNIEGFPVHWFPASGSS